MITLLAIQFAAVFLFLAARALMPELFIKHSSQKNNSHTYTYNYGHSYGHNYGHAGGHQRRRGARTTRPLFAYCTGANDTVHGAGMGMMIR